MTLRSAAARQVLGSGMPAWRIQTLCRCEYEGVVAFPEGVRLMFLGNPYE